MSGKIIKSTLFGFYVRLTLCRTSSVRHLPLTTEKLMEASIPPTLFESRCHCEGEPRKPAADWLHYFLQESIPMLT